MSLSFPTSPTVGQVYQGWTWNGQAWTSNSGFAVNSVMLGMQVFTASGTYTPNPAMVAAMIECVGGGGGGGGTIGSAAQFLVGGGGGSGGYSRKFVTAAQVGASQVVTIGAGGTAASGAGGALAGNTSVGSLCRANGGGGGVLGSGAGATGGQGASTSGAIGDFTAGGAPGEAGFQNATASTSSGIQVFGGAGGSSIFGGGAGPANVVGNAASNGIAGLSYGSGGSGGNALTVAANSAGGVGSPGIVIITEYGSGQGPAGPPGPAGTLHFNYLGGLTLANNGATSLNIATGSAASDDNTVLMSLATAFTKNCNAAWSVGNNGGALDSGSAIPAAAWLHVFLIERTDTSVVDVLVSQSATAPTMPSNYTKKRRIGSIKTVASVIQAFTQFGDEFLWTNPATAWEINTSVGATFGLLTFNVPTGVQVIVIFNAANTSTTSGTSITLYSPSQNANISQNLSYAGSSGVGPSGQFRVRSNTSGQIAAITSGTAGAANSFFATTFGWVDNRGR